MESMAVKMNNIIFVLIWVSSGSWVRSIAIVVNVKPLKKAYLLKAFE